MEDLTGKTFNYWYVVRVASEVPPGRGRFYLVRCRCGTERVVQAYEIKRGSSKSCGCFQRETRKRLSLEDRKKYAREYYQANKGRIAVRDAAVRPAKNLARKRDRSDHPEKYRALRTSLVGRYNQLRSMVARRKKLQGLPFMSFEEFSSFAGKPCHYCKLPRAETGVELDRKDTAVSYTVANVVPACTPCNLARNRNFSVEEMEREIGPCIRRVKLARASVYEVSGVT